MRRRRHRNSPRRLRSGRVRLRHIKREPGLGDGPAVQILGTLGTTFYPSWAGLNGDTTAGRGWSSATITPEPLNDTGTAAITLPNTAGSDGRLHRERFAILRNGRATPSPAGVTYRGGSYRPGDEWIEVYPEGRSTVPGFVGTPIAARVTATAVELQLADAYWIAKKQRETAGGFWCNAPRDVIEHYGSVWQAEYAHPFDDVSLFTGAKDGLQKTTSDGRWDYQNAGANPAGAGAGGTSGVLYLGNGLGQSGRVSPTGGRPLGTASSEPHTFHRIEVEYGELNRLTDNGDFVDLVLRDGGYNGPGVAELTVYRDGRVTYFATSVSAAIQGTIKATDAITSQTTRLAIEVRGKWMLFYVNGILVGALPSPAGSNDVRAQALVVPGGTGVARAVALRYFLWRRTRPFLAGRSADRGDARLPSAPAPGGLDPSSYNDADLSTLTVAERRARRLLPTRTPYARRLEPGGDTIATNAPPAGPPGAEFWSMRMVGAIFLDLAAGALSVSYNGNGKARIYIGRTRVGEEVYRFGFPEANISPSADLRTTLGNLTGWYPIIVEYLADTAALDGGLTPFRLHRGPTGGVLSPVPANETAPLGVFEDQVRYDSHFDVIERVARDFAYQFRCEPRQLETGQFPGELLPRVRVGRDTDRVLADAVGVQTTITAEDTADALLADAQGLADNTGAQITAEVLNYAELGAHPWVTTEYEQATGIAIPELLIQRLTSLLTLRGGTFEDVTANPDGERDLADTFPLTGALAEFAWRPGDALRIDDEPTNVRDTIPRPLTSIEWPATPAGLGAPQVTWRSRSRDVGQMIRDLVADVRDPQRNYQGQLVQLDGTNANNTGTSNLPIPPNARVLRVWAGIWGKSDTSQWSYQINGVTRGTFSKPGDVDVTPWITPVLPGTQDRSYFGVIGGTGTVDMQLHALVLI